MEECVFWDKWLCNRWISWYLFRYASTYSCHKYKLLAISLFFSQIYQPKRFGIFWRLSHGFLTRNKTTQAVAWSPIWCKFRHPSIERFQFYFVETTSADKMNSRRCSCVSSIIATEHCFCNFLILIDKKPFVLSF